MARLAPLAVLLLALLSCGVGLAELPVQDRDEARFAQAARQMAETGDLIDIRFLDQARHNKPALIYWFQTAALWALNPSDQTPIWVHRVPSYLAGALSALALIWAATPIIGRRGAIIAGIMCATVYMLHAEARTAKTDAALLLSVILAMGALARMWMGQTKGLWTAAIFWTAMAAGFLLKGPMVALPVAGAALWCSVHARSLTWLKALKPLPGLAWFTLLSAPWFIAITIATDGAFWQSSLGNDLTDKITATGEHAARPPGLYLLTTWMTFWPWTLLIPAALIHAWRSRATRETAFALGWLVPGWIVFEAVPVKLIHYTLPLYPALMILAAGALVILPRLRGIGGAVGAFGFLIGTTFFSFIMLRGPVEFGDGYDWPSLLGLAILVATSALAVWALWGARIRTLIASLAAAGIAMGLTLTAATLPAARDFWISERLVAATGQHECLIGPIALAGFQEPSAAFLFGGDVLITDAQSALTHLAEGENRAAWLPTLDTDPGIEGVTAVTGTNFANFRQVNVRLYVSPGIPAPADPCPG